MASFGELLREYRQRGKLSQAKLGELIGSQLGMLGGYSAAAVSDWERGKSKIDEDERLVLTSLIQVLYGHGGLKDSGDANLLLEAGNYRALDVQEKQRIFPAEPMHMASDAQRDNFNPAL